MAGVDSLLRRRVRIAVAFCEDKPLLARDRDRDPGNDVLLQVGVDLGVDQAEVGGVHPFALPDRGVARRAVRRRAADSLQPVSLIEVLTELALVFSGGHAVAGFPGGAGGLFPDPGEAEFTLDRVNRDLL